VNQGENTVFVACLFVYVWFRYLLLACYPQIQIRKCFLFICLLGLLGLVEFVSL